MEDSFAYCFLGAIPDGFAGERLVLLACSFVLKLLESFGDVAQHQEVDLSSVVVPVEGDADVSSAIPLGFDFIVVLDDALEVQRVLSADILDAEVVDDQCELHWSPVVLP